MSESPFPVHRSQLWLWFLLRRIVSYALLGGLATAIVGALLVALVGALMGWILSPLSPPTEIMQVGAIIGLVLGSTGGGLMGAFLLGISAFFSPAGPKCLPPRHFLLPTLQGMVLGTIAVTASFIVLNLTTSMATTGVSYVAFAEQTSEFLLPIMFGVPAVMMCGEIIGAVCAFRYRKMKRDA